MSLDDQKTSPGFISKIQRIADFRAVAYPPVSLTIPFGEPVVPEV